MNVEIGAEAALFPEKEYINGIAVAVWAPLVNQQGDWNRDHLLSLVSWTLLCITKKYPAPGQQKQIAVMTLHCCFYFQSYLLRPDVSDTGWNRGQRIRTDYLPIFLPRLWLWKWDEPVSRISAPIGFSRIFLLVFFTNFFTYSTQILRRTFIVS